MNASWTRGARLCLAGASRRRALLCLAGALASAACNWNVGSVEVRLVYTPNLDQNPLDRDLVKRLRVRIEGDGISSREEEFEVRTGGFGTLSDVPLGKNREVTVEGLSTIGTVESRGISNPFDTRSGRSKVYLFFSRVDRFSSPPAVVGAMEPEWASRYKTSMTSSRAFHTTTQLPDGLALVAGGVMVPDPYDFLARVADQALETVERFDPTAGAFLLEPEPPDCLTGKLCLRTARAFHSAELLSNRTHLLLVGGEPVDPGWPAEYYHIATRTFENMVELAQPRTRHACASLNGSLPGVLVAGGAGSIPSELQSSVELFSESQGAFGYLAELTQARAGSVAVAYPGGALVIGGWEQWVPTRIASARVDRIELDGNVPRLTSFDLLHARAEHTAVLLKEPGGGSQVLVCGGLGNQLVELRVEDSCERIEARAGTVTEVEGVQVARWRHTATVLADGRVLLAGGFSTAGPSPQVLKTAVLIDNPLGSMNRQLIAMVSRRAGHTATLLSNGMVLLVGGVGLMDSTTQPPLVEMASGDYEIFNPRPR